MTYAVVITEVAHDRLNEIYEQLTFNFGKASASKVINNMIEKFSNLANFPHIGRNAKKSGLRLPANYYILVIHKNVIIYTIHERTQSITIEDIYGPHQDITKDINNRINGDKPLY